MINDILDLSRVEAGKAATKPVVTPEAPTRMKRQP